MMTIQDFDRAMQEQGLKAQPVFEALMRLEVREAMDTSRDDAAWEVWAS